MPSFFRLLVSAYAESLIDDMLLIHTVYRLTITKPL